jgi:hypothetical protein
MEKRRLTYTLILPAVILLLTAMRPVHAEPHQQDGNLLQNAGFEQPFVDGTAEGWSTWASETEKQDDTCLDGYHYLPKWNMETGTDLIADGATSQYIGNNWDTWSAGVMQTVDATPGETYRFAFTAKGRATSEPAPAPSEYGINMNIRAGIDPNGSGLWNDEDIVWSAVGSPHDAWQTFIIEATATGDKITVFTSADFGVPGVNQCRQFLDTWYDNAVLVVAGENLAATPSPAPEGTQPPDTTPPASTEPTSEPPVETVPGAGGTICVNAFHDENANGLLDDNEGYMAGVTMVVAGEANVVGQAISDGSETPTCFQSLSEGSYQVAQQLPGRLEMTTASNALVAASDNHTILVAFGSRIRQDDASESTGSEGSTEEAGQGESETDGEATPDEGFDPLILIGLGILLLGVALLGLLLFFLLRR